MAIIEPLGTKSFREALLGTHDAERHQSLGQLYKREMFVDFLSLYVSCGLSNPSYSVTGAESRGGGGDRSPPPWPQC